MNDLIHPPTTVSLARIRANRNNARKSTGPKTAEGKAVCRRNALKHGLAGGGVVLPEAQAEAIQERTREWQALFPSNNTYDQFVVELAALESVRYRHGVFHDITIQDAQAQRAAESWEYDRRIEAAELARQLPRNPALVTLRLEQTIQGVDWKLDRWSYLAEALKTHGVWSESQETLALDLLGVPLDERDLDARPEDPAAVLRECEALVAEEQERLTQMKVDFLERRDQREQADSAIGMPHSLPRSLVTLRRYTTASHNRLLWAMKRLESRRAAAPFDAISGGGGGGGGTIPLVEPEPPPAPSRAPLPPPPSAEPAPISQSVPPANPALDSLAIANQKVKRVERLVAEAQEMARIHGPFSPVSLRLLEQAADLALLPNGPNGTLCGSSEWEEFSGQPATRASPNQSSA